MAKYEVQIDRSGYSHGYSKYVVEADSEEEAMEIYYEGECIESTTVRDDTEGEGTCATLVEGFNMSTITISKSEYRSLLKSQAEMERYECCGVDNWSGVDDVYGGEYFEGLTFEEECKQIDLEYADTPTQTELKV